MTLHLHHRLRISTAAVLALASTLVACTPTTTPATVANPDLAARCGIDVNLVIDRSGSVAGSQGDVQTAAQAFVDGMAGTGSRVRLASFASLATTHPNGDPHGSDAIGDLTWSIADGYQVPLLTPGGGTNLEGGLELVRRAPGPIGELTIVFTDGEPNEHYLNSPDGHPGINANLGRALSDAVGEANSIKAAGSHIVAVGIAGDTGISASTLQAISGPDEITAATPIEQGDYLPVSNFAAAIPQFRNLANRLCGPSLSITSNVMYPMRGVKDSLASTTDPGWQFDLTANPVPSHWVGTTTPSGPTTSLITGLGGTATATWNATGTTTITVHSNPRPDFTLRTVNCSAADPAGGDSVELPTDVDVDTGNWSVVVDATQRVSCQQVENINPPDPGFGQVVLVGRNRTGGLDPLALSYSLTDSTGSTATRSLSYPGVTVWNAALPGTNTVSSPSLPTGWAEYAFSCAVGGPGSYATSSRTIDVGTTQGWTCTSVAYRPATTAVLRLATVVDGVATPAPFPVRWTLETQSGGELSQSGTQPASLSWAVDPGTFLLRDDAVANQLELLGLTCDGVSQPTSGATLTLIAGSATSCTATYRQL